MVATISCNGIQLHWEENFPVLQFHNLVALENAPSKEMFTRETGSRNVILGKFSFYSLSSKPRGLNLSQ